MLTAQRRVYVSTQQCASYCRTVQMDEKYITYKQWETTDCTTVHTYTKE